MAGWFVKDHLRLIAYRILDKAATYVTNAGEPLDIHFFYGTRIEVYYRDRDKPDGLAQAIRACADQIAYAPTAAKAFELKFPTSPLPWHTGYTQLAIILEKQKRYREAINVCLDARKNGWGGNWDARTARCSKKINLK
jgi:hypothetical protein